MFDYIGKIAENYNTWEAILSIMLDIQRIHCVPFASKQ